MPDARRRNARPDKFAPDRRRIRQCAAAPSETPSPRPRAAPDTGLSASGENPESPRQCPLPRIARRAAYIASDPRFATLLRAGKPSPENFFFPSADKDRASADRPRRRTPGPGESPPPPEPAPRERSSARGLG